MRTVAIAVDVQNDFFLTTGALYVPGAEIIREPVQRIVKAVRRNRLFSSAEDRLWLAATKDWHKSPDDEHFKQWPVHCLQNSPGARIAIPELEHYADLKVHKEGYSAFEGTDFHKILLANGFQRLIVFGLAFDYCVKATALDAKKLGFEVAVALDATAPVTVEGGIDAHQELLRAEIDVRPVEELLGV